jgi:hypothetical protein
MDLTQCLGERYLWCDALCIIQDDALFKHSQIALMGFIYGQAFLTICALSSADAGVGLLGFSEAAPGGLPLDIAFSTKKYAYVSTPSNLEDTIQLLPYEQRAWTFQERLLSKRYLFFTATHFYFQCQGAGICSSNAFGQVLPYVGTRSSNLEWDPLPKPSALETVANRTSLVPGYWTLVEKYTMRQLTYAEEVLDAFAALSSNFRKALLLQGSERYVRDGLLVCSLLGWRGNPHETSTPFKRVALTIMGPPFLVLVCMGRPCSVSFPP